MAAAVFPLSSGAAAAQRSRRALRARAGSPHDRLIRVLRNLLPIAALLLFAALATVPLASGREISFVLQKDQIAIAHERLRVTRAIYSGNDGKGEPFALTAASAVQQSSADPVVKLTDLTARIELEQGPAEIVAGRGRYDMTNDLVFIDGPVTADGPHGDHLVTRDVVVSLDDRSVRSTTPVDGRTNLGSFQANRMSADLNSSVVQLDGAVRLHIPRGGVTARR